MGSDIYFKEGVLLAESGKARVYSFRDDLLLEVGDSHTLWALKSEITDYIEQLKNYPRGSVLEIGLGLGVASMYLLSFPYVTDLTTIEKNKDVIGVYNILKTKDEYFKSPFDYKPHTILELDGLSYLYATKRKFDFIFLDFYRAIDAETIPDIADMATAAKRVLKPGGKLMGWFDKYTPNEEAHRFYNLFE